MRAGGCTLYLWSFYHTHRRWREAFLCCLFSWLSDSKRKLEINSAYAESFSLGPSRLNCRRSQITLYGEGNKTDSRGDWYSFGQNSGYIARGIATVVRYHVPLRLVHKRIHAEIHLRMSYQTFLQIAVIDVNSAVGKENLCPALPAFGVIWK